ncbi:hypothetical protein HanIR_Chr08g0351701 [Helianthus annuus]|nr:hypothetical protein HanIR_Chr08g0351701 [Helianthus annuus]
MMVDRCVGWRDLMVVVVGIHGQNVRVMFAFRFDSILVRVTLSVQVWSAVADIRFSQQVNGSGQPVKPGQRSQPVYRS